VTEAGREGKLSWSVVSTDGDFMTTSRVFVAVPGVRLAFELARAGVVLITLQAVVHAQLPCMVGLEIDGVARHCCSPVSEPAGWEDLISVAGQAAEMMSPGVHSVSMIMAVQEWRPGPKDWRPGPKDWSPRRRNRPVWARLTRSPESPVVLMAVTG